MKAEVEAPNVEKERMEAVAVNDNDIITLNVGGKKMTTKRSTLCQVEGSLLASMFSGRWEDGLERDKDSCVFLDFNPKHFGLILDYLRYKRIATPDHPAPLPKVHSEQIMNFNSLVSYLGLEGDLIPKKCVLKLHSGGMNIEENGAVAVHKGKAGWSSCGYVLSENTYQKGVTRWKLFILAQNVFVGLINENSVPNLSASPSRSSDLYYMVGLLGWVLSGASLLALKDARQLYTNQSGDVVNQGEIVDLVLNCFASRLSLTTPSSQILHIDLPSSELTIWRLFIGLSYSNDKVRVLSPYHDY